MKAVFTFCTKFLDNQNQHGGFPDAETFDCSCILSILLAKRQLGYVKLHTDTRGARYLERLRLPIDEVHITLDDFNFPPHLWMASKLLTYACQTTPFVHLDLDAYLWNPLPSRLHHARIIAQSSEEDFSYYNRVVTYFLQHAGYLPDFVQRHAQHYGPKVRALNAGLYGGQDLATIHTCCQAAFETIAHPANQAMFADLAAMHGQGGGIFYDFNILLEQYFVSVYCHERDVAVDYLLSAQDCSSFTHLLGNAKCHPANVDSLKRRVQHDYPAYYELVLR